MNIDTLPDEEIISENPVKYTPFLEWDPYFIDFQTKTEDKEKYLLLRNTYVEKYPEFWRLLEVLEISFQTYRSELNRLSQLAVGFLRSAEIDDFEHWKATSKQKWNRLVLTHKQVPQEFYTILLDTANKIRNEYFEKEPIRDKILSKETDHATLYEIIGEYKQLDVTKKQLREYLIPIGLRAMIKKDPWGKSRGLFTFNGAPISPKDCATNMLNQLLVVLCMEDDDNTPENDAKVIRISPKIFFGGFEEAIDLAMLLANKEYMQLHSVLQTTKDRLGRLRDADFEPFFPYYEHLARTFLFHHKFTDTRPGLQRRHYQYLSQLFQSELGFTQAKVRTYIADLTTPELIRMNEAIEKPILEKYLGRHF